MRLLSLPLGLSIILLGSMAVAMAQVVTQDGEPVRVGTSEPQSAPVAASAPAEAPAPQAQSEPAAQSAPVEQSAPAEQSGPVEASAPAANPPEQAPAVEPAAEVAEVPQADSELLAPRPASSTSAGPRVPPPVAPPRPAVSTPKVPASDVRLPESPPKPVPKAAASSAVHSAPAVDIPDGPAWIKGCKALQMQGAVLMCDAETLLTMPSEKVQVYVRSASDITREGRFIVRESLPMRFRFFLLR